MTYFTRWFNSFHATLTGTDKIIPHTAVIVHGHRIEFGVMGLTCKPYLEVDAQASKVHKIWYMGTTTKSLIAVALTLKSLQTSSGFVEDEYNVLEKNCIDFSNTLLAQLVRRGIKIEIWQHYFRFHLSGIVSMLQGLIPGSIARSGSTMHSLMSTGRSLLASFASIPFGNHPSTSASSRSQCYFTFASKFVLKMHLPFFGKVNVRVGLGTIVDIAMVGIALTSPSGYMYAMVKVSTLILERMHFAPLRLEYNLSKKKFALELEGQTIKLTLAGEQFSMSIESLYLISTLAASLGRKSILWRSASSKMESPLDRAVLKKLKKKSSFFSVSIN